LTKNKNIIIGIVTGLLCSFVGFIIVLLLLGQGSSLNESIDIAFNRGVFIKLMIIGALLNIAAFFLFINKDHNDRAQGVLIATIGVAIATAILRFL